MVEGVASGHARQAVGSGARVLAIWICLLGLPLGYEASNLLPGPNAYYGGNATYWYSGLDVQLALMAIGLAAVLWAVLRSGGGLRDIGWPSQLRWWEWLLFAAVFAGAAWLALHHPATVSRKLNPVSASTPVTLAQRAWFLLLAVLVGAGQEIIWRGALITWLRRSIGTPGAALLSLASYVFFHPTFGLHWSYLRVGLPLAALYTGIFLWRRSLGPTVFIHFIIAAGQLAIPVAA